MVLLPSTGFSDPEFTTKSNFVSHSSCEVYDHSTESSISPISVGMPVSNPCSFLYDKPMSRGKTTSLIVARPPSSSMMATGEEKRSPARALGMVILAVGGITHCTADPVRCWLSGTCPGFSIGDGWFSVSFFLVSEVRKKASISTM